MGQQQSDRAVAAAASATRSSLDRVQLCNVHHVHQLSSGVVRRGMKRFIKFVLWISQ